MKEKCWGMDKRIVALASDHAGYALKETLKQTVQDAGCDVVDLGADDESSVDYPDYARAMADALKDKKADLGILVCGSGNGIAMAANRHTHVRAALCQSGLQAEMARRHNDANVLALGSRFIGVDNAIECVQRFLNSEFDGGRHTRRVEKMS